MCDSCSYWRRIWRFFRYESRWNHSSTPSSPVLRLPHSFQNPTTTIKKRIDPARAILGAREGAQLSARCPSRFSGWPLLSLRQGIKKGAADIKRSSSSRRRTRRTGQTRTSSQWARLGLQSGQWPFFWWFSCAQHPGVGIAGFLIFILTIYLLRALKAWKCRLESPLCLSFSTDFKYSPIQSHKQRQVL